ncbi:hypothetical protein [Cellulomonas sp. ATA003]|uniref:hypothetical protein n=1 Tax=Cellulomonas sp. ATA003 TaxID=3073064 RepID=UPI002873023F|nr:hypothetical protein [Cellulomonas sp. ATA003]WNB87112.1 hypothetical protein REH70_08325 [Cellulomonas sp. ATA003]
MDATPADARPLTRAEESVLAALLGQTFPGVEALRTQTDGLLATPGCTCGCGTVDLHVTRRPGVRRALVVSSDPAAVGFRTEGEPGTVVLFVQDGLLDRLEILSVDDPLSMPEPADLEP